MSSAAVHFDAWIRSAFVTHNTALEELYFAQDDRSDVAGAGDDIKAALRDEGQRHIHALWAEGNTGEGFESAFDVLGNVGLYLAALRRHELTNPARESRSPFAEASSLALHVGASIGMAPRFATAHLATHNRAVLGVRKSFTTLADEVLFIDENARAILSFQRAADALVRVLPLGVTNPVADVQFAAAAEALRCVLTVTTRLFETLDVARFFFSVRPYYKPYRVGRHEYRGANAGDFAGINELDLLLGLTRANDPSYAELLVDKMLFMLPAEQARLRDCMAHKSLLDEFLMLVDSGADPALFRDNARLFLDVVGLFGQTAALHHDQLVKRFIAAPAEALPPARLNGLTASGPPLDVLLRALAALRDQRTAHGAASATTRSADLARLADAIG